MTLHQHHRARGQERLRSPAQPLHYCLLLHTAATLFSTGRRTERGEGRSKKERDCTSLFLPAVRKSSRKTRRGGEAAWWLLSGITSVGAALRHYRSKPLCLCLSLSRTQRHAYTRTCMRVPQHTAAHRRAHTSTCTVGRADSDRSSFMRRHAQIKKEHTHRTNLVRADTHNVHSQQVTEKASHKVPCLHSYCM